MKKFILGIIAALSLTGCATIISGSKQEMQFNSTPTNATVFVDGKEMGKTPFSTKLTRKENHNVQIKLDGFKPYDLEVRKQFNEWYLGNLLLGGIIGLVIDPITGALYRLTPKEVNAQLANGFAFNKTKDGVLITVDLKPDTSWTKVGQLEKSID
ncbi:PEGA domain-containing protein [Pedobacter sp.]|uniref:PEGA domain-containing protein n=1 Tax=Pedobacter sp. TaxID=1411316 RepID=UPI00396CC5A2